MQRVLRLACGVERNRQPVEIELGDEWRDDGGAAPVLGHRQHNEGWPELCLKFFERRHLPETRLAPGGPEIEDHELALELGNRQLLAVKAIERYLRRWLRRRRRDKLAGFELGLRRRLGRPAQRRDDQEHGGQDDPAAHHKAPASRRRRSPVTRPTRRVPEGGAPESPANSM